MYNHAFYQHSMGSGGNAASSALSGGVQPQLQIQLDGAVIEDNSASQQSVMYRQSQIIEYLKRLHSEKPDIRAGYIDIERELKYDLALDFELVEKLKSNQSVDIRARQDGTFEFKFRPKFVIKNKRDFLRTIEEVATGIVMGEVKDTSYPQLANDASSMLVGGECIAIRNMEAKSLNLYPRGSVFLTPLSGKIRARPGSNIIETTVDLTKEIRRGEAIRIANIWYRVCSLIGSGSVSEQLLRSKAPPSVTLERDLSSKNQYCYAFDAKTLPIDSPFDGTTEYEGVAYRHGCSIDLKSLWLRAGEREEFKAHVGDREKLHGKLKSLGIVSKDLLKKEEVVREAQAGRKRHRKSVKMNEEKGGTANNSHLSGTAVGQALLEQRKKSVEEYNAKYAK